MKKSFSNVTVPNLISKFYFDKIYEEIINIGKFNEDKKILDFGCGLGLLKKKNLQKKNLSKIRNYDIISELSDVEDWKSTNFNTIIFSEVLCYFYPEEIKKILHDLRIINPKLEIISVISTQSILNKIGSKLLGHSNDHDNIKTSPKMEIEIFLNHCNLLDKKNFCNLFNVLKFNFK